jgi:hypothetical protein
LDSGAIKGEKMKKIMIIIIIFCLFTGILFASEREVTLDKISIDFEATYPDTLGHNIPENMYILPYGGPAPSNKEKQTEIIKKIIIEIEIKVREEK